MAGQNPVFYFYHGAREALAVNVDPAAADSKSPIFDGRQGEIYTFATDFTTDVNKDVLITRPETPAAAAIHPPTPARHPHNHRTPEPLHRSQAPERKINKYPRFPIFERRSVDLVEQKLERPVGLASMLHSKPEKHHPSGPVFDLANSRPIA